MLSAHLQALHPPKRAACGRQQSVMSALVPRVIHLGMRPVHLWSHGSSLRMKSALCAKKLGLQPFCDICYLCKHTPCIAATTRCMYCRGVDWGGYLTAAYGTDAAISEAEPPLSSRRDDRRCTEEPAHCIRLCRLDSWLLLASSYTSVVDSGCINELRRSVGIKPYLLSDRPPFAREAWPFRQAFSCCCWHTFLQGQLTPRKDRA